MAALDDVLDVLRCPHCGAGLERPDEAVRCGEGHSFDVARQGYLSLLGGGRPAHGGDTAAMVAARERFLGAGHFGPVAEELAEAVGQALGERGAQAGARPPGVGQPRPARPPGAGQPRPARPCIVDLGAGTGWYLARVLDRLPAAAGLALDISKPALRRAARAHPRIAAAACDAWRVLPLRDHVAAALLNVFAPRNGPEMARILEPDGVAAFVTPTSQHLNELVASLGLLTVDERKEARLVEQLAPELEIIDRRELEWRLQLDRAGAGDAVAMGPSAFHVSPADLEERIAALPAPVGVTAAVTVTLAIPTKATARLP